MSGEGDGSLEFGWIVAFFTIVLGISGYFQIDSQLDVQKEQLAVQKKQLEIQKKEIREIRERHDKDYELAVKPILLFLRQGEESVDAGSSRQPRLHNIGNGPATNIEVRFTWPNRQFPSSSWSFVSPSLASSQKETVTFRGLEYPSPKSEKSGIETVIEIRCQDRNDETHQWEQKCIILKEGRVFRFYFRESSEAILLLRDYDDAFSSVRE